ncbi:unnamed protein product, partial [Symbiodinium pilosum]
VEVVAEHERIDSADEDYVYFLAKKIGYKVSVLHGNRRWCLPKLSYSPYVEAPPSRAQLYLEMGLMRQAVLSTVGL